ncbi:uncharacterized protein LOC111868956 [Cryptotermes secundus]|uniref:uncharacterized protein LOC111868956 n=1 Tax=Cryptotermes secundus TaxID=105785 RepID=UPI001454CE08|nr:uncharacterized protein LOC111868956 [Cryptotermes secundus]
MEDVCRLVRCKLEFGKSVFLHIYEFFEIKLVPTSGNSKGKEATAWYQNALGQWSKCPPPARKRPQLDVSLPPRDDPQILAYCILSENPLQSDFGEFPHHPLEGNTQTILSGPTSRNPVDLNHVRTEARTCTYPSTRKLSSQVPAGNKTETCRSAIMHEV